MATNTLHKWIFTTGLALFLGMSLPAWPQEEAPAPDTDSGGWRKFDQRAPEPQNDPAPSTVTLPAGTWIKVRTNDELSSDHNQTGDGFTATLTQPLVANGIVVARRGQTIGGRVAVAEKAGRRKGTSRLGIELVELGLVDGRQVPIRTSLSEYEAGTSKGRDAGVVVAGTATGAAIGAAAQGGGLGAGIGAIAGGIASSAVVLATRGKPTVVYPESELTFRLEEPVTISTADAPLAFRPVTQADYDQRMVTRQVQRGREPYSRYYGYGPYWGYYDPYFYPYWGWGPSFYYYSGPGFYGGGHRVYGGGRMGGGRRR